MYIGKLHTLVGSDPILILLCAPSVIFVSLWSFFSREFINHRGTETTEVTQRNPKLGLYPLVVLLVGGLAFIVTQAQQPPAVNMITAEELKAKIAGNQPLTIIDVRSTEGFANSSTTMKGSLHFKVRKLKSRLQYAPLKDLPRDREIVTYCACPKDESSIAAAQILQSSGFTRVRVLQGGWNEWLKVNGPVQPRAKN